MRSRRGVVYWDKIVAGRIEELPNGNCRFEYDPRYRADPDSQPISLTLPLGDAVFETRGLHPFFDGLVPEGWLLDLASRNWKIDPRDRVGLLLSVCSDCVGAVRVVQLKKVKELTLHAIALQKTMDEQKARLEQRLQRLGSKQSMSQSVDATR